MINTDAYDLSRDIPNLAIGYTRDNEDGQRQNNLFLHVIKGCSAGGGFSTVEDLLHFALALESNKLVNAQYTKLITTCKPKTFDPKNRYAYGFEDKVINGKRVYGHGGGFPGINSQLDIYPELGYIVAVMANYDPPAAFRVANKVRQLITR